MTRDDIAYEFSKPVTRKEFYATVLVLLLVGYGYVQMARNRLDFGNDVYDLKGVTLQNTTEGQIAIPLYQRGKK